MNVKQRTPKAPAVYCLYLVLLGLHVGDHIVLLTPLKAGTGWDELSDDDVFHEA